MNLVECKNEFVGQLRQATLCFLCRDKEILLAMKKRGFGKGRYNGPGGKPEGLESVEEAIKREVKEEIGVEVGKMEKVAVLDFYFASKPEWNQQVTVFKSIEWQGEPVESEEMAPEWFVNEKIPYEKMWPDDIYWLPKVIEGKKIRASFLFGENDVVLEKEVVEVVEI